jgi:hypothetical protein
MERILTEICNVTQDFVYASQAYGRIIISEVFLPDTMKSIQPINIGGVAGGQKFLVQNILVRR